MEGPIKPIAVSACLAFVAALVASGPRPDAGPTRAGGDVAAPPVVADVAPLEVVSDELLPAVVLGDELPPDGGAEGPGGVASALGIEAERSVMPVVASYFGPGLYGNRTACGQTLTTELIGVAHRTLPCGRLVTLEHGASSVTVPVVDRGPFIWSREFDLTYATKVGLGCADLCALSWVR